VTWRDVCAMSVGAPVALFAAPGQRAANETVGVCFSFAQFQYDSNNDMVPDALFPNCDSLPKRSVATPGVDDDAADFGCQPIAESMFAPFTSKASAPMMSDFRLGNGAGEAVTYSLR